MIEGTDTLDRTAPVLVVVALVMALACPSTASALDTGFDVNQYAHTAWTLRDGLAEGQVTSIAQTPDGYLWLGTEFGLLRFDGVRSMPWRQGGMEQLPSTWIRSLLATDDGTLWIGTLEGLASWKNGKLTQYQEFNGHSVDTLLSDDEGTVWAGGYVGLTGTLCSIANGRTRCWAQGFGRWVGSLYQDPNGVIWATAETGLWRWRKDADARQRMREPTIGSSQALDQESEGNVVIAVEHGIRRVVDGKSTDFRLPGVRFAFRPDRLLHDRDGGLWIGTFDHGLLHVHQGRTDVYPQSDGLSGNFVTRLFEDREGNIWVATKNGLDRFRDLAVRTISNHQALPSAPPWSVITARDGSIWLGSIDGLSRWKSGDVTTFRAAHTSRRNTDGARRRREVFDSGLPDNSVGALFEDGQGRLWVSTLRGIAYFENGRFVPVTELPPGPTSVITGDDHGSLWILSAAHGVYRLQGSTVVERLPWAALGATEPATALLPDNTDGGVWLGFPGTVTYVKDGSVRGTYPAAVGRAHARVNELRRDSLGALWIATDAGLSRLQNGRVVTLTSTRGLPCDAVHWSMEAGDGSTWLYMPCGLVQVPATALQGAANDTSHTIHPTIYTGSDGVALRVLPPLYRPQVAKTADGQLWFLPGDGVSVFDPRRLPDNKLPPPVHIERITANRRIYEATPNLQLPPLIRNLEIDYSGLSLVAPEKNRFRVRLDGHDSDWQDMGNRHQAFYADLPPGNYRFRVTAANNSGVWNDRGMFVDFSIAPAYFQAGWFRAGLTVAILTLLWILYRLRLRGMARSFDVRLDERVNERMRIARELHDTLLQSFQGLMLRFQSARDLLPADPGKAAEALDLALDRGDGAIVEGRDAIQNLRSSTTVNTELTEAMTAFAEEFARTPRGAQTTAAFRASVEGSPRQLHPLLRDDVFRIACEALRNAYRHAQASHIEAEVTYGARNFCVRVRDDGTGIEPDYLKKAPDRHWGLVSMRERARRIGSELSLWSVAGGGTEIELRIPATLAYGASSRTSLLKRVLRKDVAHDY